MKIIWTKPSVDTLNLHYEKIVKIIGKLNIEFNEEFSLDDIFIYNNKERNLILKIKNFILKFYENDFHLNKEKVVYENLNRQFLEIDNVLVYKEIKGRSVSRKDMNSTFFLKIYETLSNFWERNSNLNTQIYKRNFGKKRTELINEIFKTDDADVFLEMIRIWENSAFSEIIFAHGDLNPGNILMCDDNIELIDFEFSGVNEKHFELSSLIVENKFTIQQINSIIKIFNIEDIENLYLNIKIFSLRTCIDWYSMFLENKNVQTFKKYETKKKYVMNVIKNNF